jgi:hypothetical protein
MQRAFAALSAFILLMSVTTGKESGHRKRY